MSNDNHTLLKDAAIIGGTYAVLNHMKRNAPPSPPPGPHSEFWQALPGVILCLWIGGCAFFCVGMFAWIFGGIVTVAIVGLTFLLITLLCMAESIRNTKARVRHQRLLASQKTYYLYEQQTDTIMPHPTWPNPPLEFATFTEAGDALHTLLSRHTPPGRWTILSRDALGNEQQHYVPGPVVPVPSVVPPLHPAFMPSDRW